LRVGLAVRFYPSPALACREPQDDLYWEHGRYSIKDLNTLKGVLGDTFVLYDVTTGRGRLSDLLALVEKHADTEVFSLIIFDLARFLRPRLQTRRQAIFPAAVSALVANKKFDKSPPSDPEEWSLHHYVEVEAHLGIIKPDTATESQARQEIPQP
jgi:hypothetical protein